MTRNCCLLPTITVICLVLLPGAVKTKVISLTATLSPTRSRRRTLRGLSSSMFRGVSTVEYKNSGTLREDLGKEMEGEDEIEIGEVDCGLGKPVCSKVDIHSYPTFNVFYDGEEVAKYQGSRNVDSLKAFVLEEADKAARKAQFGDEQEL